jgi:phage terminase small subunit
MTVAPKFILVKRSKSSKKAQKSPHNLKKAGEKLWESVAETSRLEEHDITLLTALAETLDRKNEALVELKKAGHLTFVNRYGETRPHPLVGIVRDCNASMAKLRRELNLSEIPLESRPPKLRYGG